ncbi:hypothetical protein [Tsukamurella sp. PLM1]|uniref:hypothetical protein n=1 Tax=Tsukamurella sp. PLM1 TaxID=2929795 RepID=UPI00204934D2|nr:hypothetical protein [Tsukamurella sp. PLM1]BDH55211.1 hypothetical protein MTP03_01500 [Tsukamurella sp. PLM1]
MPPRPVPPPPPQRQVAPPRPAAETPAQPSAAQPDAARPGSAEQGPRPSRVIPPPEEQVAAKVAAAQGAAGPGAAPSAPEPPRSKPDPLTDPLTSETFQGVAPEPDTFEAGRSGGFGYSTSSTTASGFDGGFDGGFDQFAPPKFDPSAQPTFERPAYEPPRYEAPSAPGTGTDGADASTAAAETLDEPDESYIDVEVVDVVHHAPEPPRLPEPLAIDPFPYTQIDETYVDAETLQSLHTPTTPHEPEEPGDMTDFNESLNEAMAIDGALGVALVDAASGMALATAGDPAEFNLEVAAAGNSALVQAMGRTLGDLDLDDHIEDILITLGTQYQIVRPINQGTDDLFLYLVLDRSRANLAMARFRLTKLAEQIEV